MHYRAFVIASCGLFAASGAMGGLIGASDILDLQVVSESGTWNLADNLGTVTNFQQDGTGTWIIEGVAQTSDWTMDWGFEVNQTDAARGLDSASISSSFAFTNTTGNDAALFEVIGNALVGALSGPTTQTGSISGSLGSGNPLVETAMLSTPTGDFLFTGLVDGAGVQTLLDDSFGLSTNLTASFGPANNLNLPGGGVLSTIGIRHSFGLTDGDNAQFAGVFLVTEVPAPGAAALLGLGGLAATRRRR